MIYGEGHASEKLMTVLYQRYVQGPLGTDAEVMGSDAGGRRYRARTGFPEKVASAVSWRVSWKYREDSRGEGRAEQKLNRKTKGALWSENRAAEFCVVRGEDAE